MKAQKRISYSEDVDILMIQLSDKKIDDSYDTEDMIVQVDKDKEPVLLEIFNGRKFLKDLGEAIPQKLQKQLWSQQVSTSVPHQIKKWSKDLPQKGFPISFNTNIQRTKDRTNGVFTRR